MILINHDTIIKTLKKISFLVKEQYRTHLDILEIQEKIKMLGFTITGCGKASITAEVQDLTLTENFDIDFDRFQDSNDKAFQDISNLSVPPELKEYINSMSIIPKAEFY